MSTLTWKDENERVTVVNQFEALRQNGSNNMMDFRAVVREASDSNFHHFVNYFGNDNRKYTSFLFSFDQYEDFIDDDLVNEWVDLIN